MTEEDFLTVRRALRGEGTMTEQQFMDARKAVREAQATQEMTARIKAEDQPLEEPLIDPTTLPSDVLLGGGGLAARGIRAAGDVAGQAASGIAARKNLPWWAQQAIGLGTGIAAQHGLERLTTPRPVVPKPVPPPEPMVPAMAEGGFMAQAPVPVPPPVPAAPPMVPAMAEGGFMAQGPPRPPALPNVGGEAGFPLPKPPPPGTGNLGNLVRPGMPPQAAPVPLGDVPGISYEDLYPRARVPGEDPGIRFLPRSSPQVPPGAEGGFIPEAPGIRRLPPRPSPQVPPGSEGFIPPAPPTVPRETPPRPPLSPEQVVKSADRDTAGKLRKAVNSARQQMPVHMNQETENTARSVTRNVNRNVHEKELTAANFRAAAQGVEQNWTVPERIDAMVRHQKGLPQLTKERDEVMKPLAELLANDWREVEAFGPDKPMKARENYFPQLWKSPADAEQVFFELKKKGTLSGSGSFTHRRAFDDIEQGLAAGLELKLDNPVEATLFKHNEIQKWLTGQRIGRDLKKLGYVSDEQLPGWVRYDDRSVLANKFGPGGAAKIIENHVQPGLVGNGLYDFARAASNSANQLQLGASAFHATATMFNAAASDLGLGIQQAARGEIVRGVKTGSRSLAGPYSLIRQVRQGSRLFDAALGRDASPAVTDLANYYLDVGGRVFRDPQYFNRHTEALREALKDRNVVSGVWHAPLAAVEQLARPTMEYLVPRAKAGAFMDLAGEELAKLPVGTGESERLQAVTKAFESVENRFGQVNYDTWHMNKAFKDALFIGTRAPGWTIGSIRELGGGVADLARGRISSKAAFSLAVPLTTAFYGSLYQLYRTGTTPEITKDPAETIRNFAFPKNGTTTPEGTDGRTSLPGYWDRDVWSWFNHPFQTLVNKGNPWFSIASDIYQGHDSRGVKVYEPEDRVPVKTAKSAAYAAKSLAPISFRQATQPNARAIPGVTGMVEQGLGFAPASREHTDTDAMAVMRRAHAEHTDLVSPQDLVTRELKAGLVRQLRENKYKVDATGQPPEAVRKLLEGRTERDQNRIGRALDRRAAKPAIVAMMDSVPAETAYDAYLKASPKERAMMAAPLKQKIARMQDSAKQKALQERIQHDFAQEVQSGAH